MVEKEEGGSGFLTGTPALGVIPPNLSSTVLLFYPVTLISYHPPKIP